MTNPAPPRPAGGRVTLHTRDRADRPLKNGNFAFYDVDESTDWELGVNPGAGTLGESPMVFLGLYDVRPWEGQPVDPGAPQDWEQMQRVDGDLILRLQSNPVLSDPGSNLFGPSVQSDGPLYQSACLSLVISGWSNTLGKTVWGDPSTGDGKAVASPNNPEQETRSDFASGQAWMGPDLLPSFAGSNMVKVDLGQWARGSRFVGVWLWPYWVGQAVMPALPFAWETWDVPISDRDNWRQLYPISYPQRVVPLGTMPIPPPVSLLTFRYGPLPGASAYRLAVRNEGPELVRIEWHRHVGPAYNSQSSALASTAHTILPLYDQAGVGLGTAIDPSITHHLVYTVTNSLVNLGGPIILTLSGSPYGV